MDRVTGLCYECKYSMKERQPSSIMYCKKLGKLMPNQKNCKYFKADYGMLIDQLFEDIKIEANMTDDEIMRMKLNKKKQNDAIPVCVYNKKGILISKNFYNSDGILIKGPEAKK